MSLVEDLLFCPYNRAHRIRPDAMPKHLYKCRRNHPKTKLVICPFNTIHHVPGPELNTHIAECPDRAAFELYKYCITDGSRQSHTPTALEPELIYNNEPPRRSLTPESGFGDAEEATRRSLQDDDECWDESAVPAYNPHAYCKSANVIRKATNMKKSQKREFYQAERERLNGWRSGSTSSESDDGCREATTLAGADEWWDDEVAPAKEIQVVPKRTTSEKKQVHCSDQQLMKEMDKMSMSFAQKLKMNQKSK
ncbi:gametocyte-specific factor 1 homolog [Culex pipiens pallens]|uniref:gametocyte-specific factor 1 homolog n=1 Tax=Culex pipiens pallens TaxID=42434 RepID=UPI001952FCF6|nr:gametocyte-specific factor 1 homolog [Culex pipiens pallens]